MTDFEYEEEDEIEYDWGTIAIGEKRGSEGEIFSTSGLELIVVVLQSSSYSSSSSYSKSVRSERHIQIDFFSLGSSAHAQWLHSTLGDWL